MTKILHVHIPLCRWVQGFESISKEMTDLISNAIPYFNPLRLQGGGASSVSTTTLQGTQLLCQLLPHHQSPQVYLLVVAILLGRPAIDIPFSARFDLESLDAIFQTSSGPQSLGSVRLCADAAFVLLAMARAIVHKVSSCSDVGACESMIFLAYMYV